MDKMKKPTLQKNALLKNAQANAESNFFKRVFFSPTQEKIQIIFFPTLRFFNYLFFQRTEQTLNCIASNVNRFVESVCGHEQNRSGRTAAHAGNIRLNEIKKRRALFGNQSVVLLSSIIGKRTVMHLIPSFFYFVNPFFVSGNFF